MVIMNNMIFITPSMPNHLFSGSPHPISAAHRSVVAGEWGGFRTGACCRVVVLRGREFCEGRGGVIGRARIWLMTVPTRFEPVFDNRKYQRGTRETQGFLS